MSHAYPSDLIRSCFAAYESKDRALLESLLSDDFTFSSPLDDNISRERYFERCWPNSEHVRAFHIKRLFLDDNEAFVNYECEALDGTKFQNTEFFSIEDGKIRHVEVYFGSEDGKAASEAEVRTLIEATVQACRDKDATAMVAHYSPQVRAFDLINPLEYHGADAVEKRAQQWLSSFEGPIDYDLHDLKVTASDDTAFCHSLNHVHGKKADGMEIDMWWRATLGFQKIDGHWQVTHSHSSEPFDMESGKASLDLRP